MKYDRKNVFMFIALNSRFSTEDLGRYSDMALKRILVGISKDAKNEEVRVWADGALANGDDWSQEKKR